MWAPVCGGGMGGGRGAGGCQVSPLAGTAPGACAVRLGPTYSQIDEEQLATQARGGHHVAGPGPWHAQGSHVVRVVGEGAHQRACARGVSSAAAWGAGGACASPRASPPAPCCSPQPMLTSLSIPDAHCPVIGAGQQPAAQHSHVVHPVRVRLHARSARHGPATGLHAPPVRRHAWHGGWALLLCAARSEAMLRGLPPLDGGVPGGREQRGAIWRQVQGLYASAVLRAGEAGHRMGGCIRQTQHSPRPPCSCAHSGCSSSSTTTPC